MKRQFIVIEGIDGCGKTTQINELSKWLPSSGIMSKDSTLITTREPGGSLLGKKLRKLILDNDKNNKPSSIAELLLYSADRAEKHVSKIIKPALAKNNWVLSDRFSDSTLAYQGYGRGINIKAIKQIDSIVCQGESPDLTIYLEISAEESIARRKNKIPDRIESEGIQFLEKVNKGFNLIAKQKQWIVIPASQSVKDISHQIRELLIKRFHNK